MENVSIKQIFSDALERLEASASHEEVLPSPIAPNSKRFEVKCWKAIAMWSWDACTTICMICRNQIMDVCIECQANCDELNFDRCPIAWGACGHAYHDHCIHRFLKIRNVCPLDNQEWQCSKYGR